MEVINMYGIVTLGKTSRKRLDTCADPLQSIIISAAADPECPCDFGVVCGGREEEDQNRAYAEGKSNAWWGESDHNVMKGDKPFSMGIDLAPYEASIRNYVWGDELLFSALASHIMKHASKLGYSIEWGGIYKLRNGKNDPGHFSLLFK